MGMHVCVTIVVYCLGFSDLKAQSVSTRDLLAYEPFAGQPGTLNLSISGSGWSGPWVVQNDDVSTPGYTVSTNSPLTYSGLTTSASYASGGNNYESSGRALDTTPDGPFGPFLANGLIGSANTTLWLSCLLRKDVDSEDELSLTLVPGNVAWWTGAGAASVGYFRSPSDLTGSRLWGLRIDGVVYPTTHAISVGEAVLILLKVEFGAPSTVSVWINPPIDGVGVPSPDVQTTTSVNLAFNNVAFYGGANPGDGSIDEIRLATDYGAALGVALPPPAAPQNLIGLSGDGQVNLVWQASAGATSYIVSLSGGSGVSVLSNNTPCCFFDAGNLSNGASYTFLVQAQNSSGFSGPSTISASPSLASGLAGLLAYESFSYSPGPLLSAAGGSGWAAGWDVQNNSVSIPGFSVSATAPLQYQGLNQSGNYGSGGNSYLMAGRAFDVSSSGPFANYSGSGLVGLAGKTIWTSLLMRKDANTEDEFSITLHPGDTSWWVQTPGPSIGYFGLDSEVAGNKFWSLRVDGVVYQTSVPIVLGTPALLVLREDFGVRSTLALYVDPPIGSSPPNTPDAYATTASPIGFQSLAYESGAAPNQTAIDEIRVAGTFQSVLTDSVGVPSAPTGLTATVATHQVTLSWNTVGGATNYEVLSCAPSCVVIATVSGTTFTQNALINATSYTYCVTASNTAGTSGPSLQVAAVPRGAAPPPYPSLGSNLAAVSDYTREWPFVDVFKLARPWISQQQGAPWGQGGPLQTTPEGWIAALAPGQYAETIILDNATDGTAFYPSGNYTLLYDGQGTIAFDLGSGTVVSQAPGSMVVNVPPGGVGIYLEVTSTNPTDPIRNIRFIMPGFESTYLTQPFHPAFLATFQNLRALRFMEWMLTNNSTVVNWSDRPQLSDYTYSLRGVPIELMVQLANTLGINPWFNMPHAANDDFVQQFATLVKQQLDPSLHVYLEYSNETWNGIFSQNAYVQEQGLHFGLSQDPVSAGNFYTAQRSGQIFDIWQGVFGGTSSLVRVLPAQAANSALSEQLVAFAFGNAFGNADALAIAPYFDCSDQATGGWGSLSEPSTAAQVSLMTVDQVLDIETEHIHNCSLQQMSSNATVANMYGLKLVAYEGGQSLAGIGSAQDNTALTNLFMAANRNPRMKDLYTQYLANWKTIGGDIFVHYTDVGSYGMYGSWGSMEYQTQDPSTAPKFQALQAFAAQNQ